MAGATPVYVEIDPRTYLMDVSQMESRLTSRTRAILPVHLYGQMADMDPIMEFAARHNLVVIEDAAQAHGAEYKGRRSGSIGHFGCFSFYYSKNLGAYGEAGGVVTSDAELARRLPLYRDHGSERRYHHLEFGFNSRMDEIQAAILRIRLRQLDIWNVLRAMQPAAYDQLLAGADVGLPVTGPNRTHVWYVYITRSGDRRALPEAMTEREHRYGRSLSGSNSPATRDTPAWLSRGQLAPTPDRQRAKSSRSLRIPS